MIDNWKPSYRAETSPDFQELIGHIEAAIERDEIDEYSFDSNRLASIDDEFDEPLDEIIDQLHQLDMSGMTPEEHRSVSCLLSADQPEWGYGETQGEDQLFDYETPALRQPADDTAIEVLTGVAGTRILDKKHKEISQLLERFANTPHERRVLLGTAALIAIGRRSQRWEDYPGFDNGKVNGITSRVEVFADFHGDFRMREVYQADRIVDPLGRERFGAPAIDSNYVAGYHSVEPYLLMNVLVHQAKRMDANALREFADNVLQRIYSDKTLEVKVGPYADWGTESGRYEAGLLRELITEGDTSTINSLTVRPQGREQLVVESNTEGIAFRNLTSDTEGQAIAIANDKIGDFVVALIGSSHGHGRTAPGALLRILDVARSADDSQLL